MKRATRYAFVVAALASAAAVLSEFFSPLNCWARGRHDTERELTAAGPVYRCLRCGRALTSVLTAMESLEDETVEMWDQSERISTARERRERVR